tara:strand:- start:2006 stop:2470 length:465 start_codon:yes stop_codon:yes gene_type:complete
MYRKNTTSILNEWKNYLSKDLNESQAIDDEQKLIDKEQTKTRERDNTIKGIMANCSEESVDDLSEESKIALIRILQDFRSKTDRLINAIQSNIKTSSDCDDVLEAILNLQNDSTLEEISHIEGSFDASEEGLDWMANRKRQTLSLEADEDLGDM